MDYCRICQWNVCGARRGEAREREISVKLQHSPFDLICSFKVFSLATGELLFTFVILVVVVVRSSNFPCLWLVLLEVPRGWIVGCSQKDREALVSQSESPLNGTRLTSQGLLNHSDGTKRREKPNF